MNGMRLLWLFVCIVTHAWAQSGPVQRPADKGLDYFYNLDYDKAIAEFQRDIQLYPNSPTGHNRTAQAIEFRELFRVGALESELVSGNNSFLRRPKIDTTPETEKQFFEHIDKSIALCQAMLQRNQNDTKALYSLGVAYGLRANWNFLVRKSWRDALRDATEGRKLHNRVTELDAGNYDARLMQGAHDYVVGSLPFFYKMLGFLIGFRGDKDEGIRTLQQVAAKGDINQVDAKVFLCTLYRREKRWNDAEPLLAELIRMYPRNYLFRFEEAQMYSATGQKDKALGVIRKVAELKKEGTEGFKGLPDEKIRYQLGNIHFWYRDYEDALNNLRKVTDGISEVDLNTGALAWMRIGQIYDLTNRRPLAKQAYQKCIEFAPEAEAAKESRRYLSSPFRREKGA